MIFLAYSLLLLIGVSLGLMGSGGAIFCIPVLVYLLNTPPSLAASYSLFIVGIGALVGSLSALKNKLVNKKMVLLFGLPSVLGVWLVRRFVLSLLPPIWFASQHLVITKNVAIMCLFAVVMLFAAYALLRPSPSSSSAPSLSASLSFNARIKTAFQGFGVGLLTGFFGVGGGFLIIPVLVVGAHMPMKNAVATSLSIIVINAVVGFGVSPNSSPIDWLLLLSLSAFVIIGIVVGLFLSKKISNQKLKPLLGAFIAATGLYILIKELFL